MNEAWIKALVMGATIVVWVIVLWALREAVMGSIIPACRKHPIIAQSILLICLVIGIVAVSVKAWTVETLTVKNQTAIRAQSEKWDHNFKVVADRSNQAKATAEEQDRKLEKMRESIKKLN